MKGRGRRGWQSSRREEGKRRGDERREEGRSEEERRISGAELRCALYKEGKLLIC